MRAHPTRFFLALWLGLTLAAGIPLHLWLEAQPLVAWLVPANVFAFVLWGVDKLQARRKGLRVPELVLHTMALTGATPASFLAVAVFRHKTLKLSFKVLYVLFLVLQVAALAYAFGARS